AFGLANVIAGGKQVTGVQTESQPLRSLNPIINSGQMIQIMAETAPLPGGVLEGNSDHGARSRVEHFVEPRDDLLQCRRLAVTQMRSRMHDQERQPKLRRKLDLLNE